ncbi:PEGA domain-containing protein [Edaphobacter modestus]|uniref:PEGA domain-containing protein n=2 Tax=Edaphobacter modestus TaxID=388466 RepID=A0A4Q7YWS9_9BACT|nr:PEGA domain-containing protein [Edaphobacter modestus]
MKKLMLLGLAALTFLVPSTAFCAGRGGVVMGQGFGPFGFYGPYGPAGFGAYPFAPYTIAPNAGEVRIDTHVKDASVFINGNYAGRIGQLKTMTMLAGNYNIEIREPGRPPFDAPIFVVAGKSIKLRPDVNLQVPTPSPHS